MFNQQRLLKPFHIMVKPRGAICNLSCDYCYFLKKEGLYPKSDFRMSEAVLAAFTKQYIQAQPKQVNFAWQGGEPTLMGLDFYRHALAYQAEYQLPGQTITNVIQTNGTLLNEAWCQFFKENDFLVGLSMDGPAHLHDIYRKDKGGGGSFAKVKHGFDLLQKYGIKTNILCCVHAGNAAYPLEVYRYFRDHLAVQHIQFIPIVERANKSGEQKGNRVTKRSVTGEQYGAFLTAIFDEWVRHDVGQVFVQIFDMALGKWLNQAGGLCVFNETCGGAMALEHNGDLYSCDHYVEARYKIGNILKTEIKDLAGSHKQLKFGIQKRTELPQYCQNCSVLFVCNGGCPKNRILQSPDNEARLNYLCDAYMRFFKHIDKPMRRMAELIRSGKAPSLIMREMD